MSLKVGIHYLKMLAYTNILQTQSRNYFVQLFAFFVQKRLFQMIFLKSPYKVLLFRFFSYFLNLWFKSQRGGNICFLLLERLFPKLLTLSKNDFRKPLFIFKYLSNNISHVRVEIKKKITSHFTYRGATLIKHFFPIFILPLCRRD